MVGSVATLLLLATLASPGGREASAQLRVSARVVQSTAVSVGAGPRGPAVHVRGADGTTASVPLGAAHAGVSVAPHPREEGYVVVTVLLDAPPRGERSARDAGP